MQAPLAARHEPAVPEQAAKCTIYIFLNIKQK